MTSDDPVVAAFRRAAEDRERGAAEIEARLIGDLLQLRSRWTSENLGAGLRRLVEGQPTMANLLSLAGRVDPADPGSSARRLAQRARVLEALPARLAEAAWPKIAAASRLVTISRSSAVAAVVAGARERGWSGTVVVLDGSPAGGGPSQASALAASGPTLSQPDAAALRWLEGDAVVVAVGADAVGPRAFVNCTGTRALLELASLRRVPSLLVADTGKDASPEVVDEIAASAPVCREGGVREWPLFETVALDLITLRVSERTGRRGVC